MTEAQDPTDARRRPHPVILLVVAALLAMWGYVVYLAVFVGRADSPDKIDESAFVDAAEQRCARAVAFVETLPRAEEQADDPVGRSDTIAEATSEFESMVTDLRTLGTQEIDSPDDADLVRQWLDDWDTVVSDRFDYADRLRVDPEARLLVTPGPNGRQVSLQVDEFAGTNDMPSCKSPLDA